MIITDVELFVQVDDEDHLMKTSRPPSIINLSDEDVGQLVSQSHFLSVS